MCQKVAMQILGIFKYQQTDRTDVTFFMFTKVVKFSNFVARKNIFTDTTAEKSFAYFYNAAFRYDTRQILS